VTALATPRTPILIVAPLVLPAGLGRCRRRDYAALPDRQACELLLGRIYGRPRPSVAHDIVLDGAWRQLKLIAAATGGRAYRGPVDIALADHSVVKPDVFYLSAGQRDLVVGQAGGAPDLVVEVLSPETVRQDRREKLSLYARCGVKEYWLLDPEPRVAEFLVNEAGRFVVTLPDAGRHRSPTIAGLTLDLTRLWQSVEEALHP
jgi:Uma2 family endonuclease